MESFNVFKKATTEGMATAGKPVEANDNSGAPKAESGPDPVLVQTNVELRGIVNDLRVIEKPADRVPVFERMFKGPEVVTDDPAIIPFFDRISAIEDRYGRDAVREIAILYGADRITGA